MSLPAVNEYPTEVSASSNFEEFFEGIVLWPPGRGCCGRCIQRLGGIPLRFEDPNKEQLWRQQHRWRLTSATRRVGKVALVAHLLAVMAELSALDFGNLTQAQVLYSCCMSIMAILAIAQICFVIPEVGVSVIYVLASVALMLTSRSRAAFLAGMDFRSAWAPGLPPDICLCVFTSDAILVGNFACVILVYFVVMPVRSKVSVWCMPVFPLAYLALSLPVPEADGGLVRKLNLAFRILICAFVGLLGRCWIEIGERASFLRLQNVQKDLTKEKVLRAVAEHEIERGPFSNSTPKSELSNIGPMPGNDQHSDLQSDLQSGVTSRMSRPLSSIVFTPRAGDAAPVAMQLKAMKAMAAEEKWLIDWPDITFQSNLLGKGGFALVLEGSYAGAKVAVKLPLGDQLTTTMEVLDFCGKELRVLRRLRHPSIVSFYGACIEESRCLVLIVEEFIAGLSLFDAVLNQKDVSAELSEGKRREILEIICQALVYLHDQGPSILHGDLSPKNVLLRSGSLTPVLVDFGMSVLRKSHQKMAGGSPQWMAPELLCSLERGGLKPDCSLDIFSFGRIAFFVSTSQLPFPRRSVEDMLEAAKSGSFCEMPWPLEDVTDLQMFCKEEICPRCLERDPKQRISAEETLAVFRRHSPQTPVLGMERPSVRPSSLNSVLQVVDQVSVDLRSGYLSTINADVVAQRKKKIPL